MDDSLSYISLSPSSLFPLSPTDLELWWPCIQSDLAKNQSEEGGVYRYLASNTLAVKAVASSECQSWNIIVSGNTCLFFCPLRWELFSEVFMQQLLKTFKTWMHPVDRLKYPLMGTPQKML